MNTQQIINEHIRLRILQLLNETGRLSPSLMANILEKKGTELTTANLQNNLQYLREQGWIIYLSADSIALTDEGLDIVKGKRNAIGVATPSPTEISKVRESKKTEEEKVVTRIETRQQLAQQIAQLLNDELVVVVK